MTNTTNNKTKQTTRERIFSALFELIQTHKIQDISVSELCEHANINRTTFYNHYDNVRALAQDARESILQDYVRQFEGNTDGYTPENLLIMFQHIYDNQLIYHTYFQLNPSYQELLDFYDRDLAAYHYPGQTPRLIRYHAEFFAAGLTTIICRWLETGCRETPAEMVQVVTSEYRHRSPKVL